MPRTRPLQASRSRYSLFGPLAVLALLAFACFVPAAQADAPETEYRDATPTVTGTDIPKESGGKNTAKVSHADGGGSEVPSEGDSGSEGEPSEGTTGGSGAGSDDGQGQGGQGQKQPSQSKSQNDAGKQSGGQLSASEPVAKTTGDQGGGGSSPLVPILIAIAVVMAVAIGAVVYRNRRQQTGSGSSSVSPKAS